MKLARREVVSMAVVACKDKDQILKSLVSALTLVVHSYIYLKKHFFLIKLSLCMYITVRSGS